MTLGSRGHRHLYEVTEATIEVTEVTVEVSEASREVTEVYQAMILALI